MIGIIGAMEEEVRLYISRAGVEAFETYAKMKFYRCFLGSVPVVVVCSGVGKVSAAVATQILIDRFGVNQIIFTGLAGALVPYLQKGDIVIANYLVQYDVDLSAFGRRVGDVPSIGRMIEADPELIRQATEAYDNLYGAEPKRPQMIVGTIVSGDKFISDKKTIGWLQREFGAVATEMEGAAVAQVSQMNEIPFIVIRTISDFAGSEATEEFKDSLEKFPENTYQIIKELLSNKSEIVKG